MSLKNCMIILKLYAEISGLGINLEKKVVWIESEKYSRVKMCQEYNLHWEKDEFCVLGITFPKDLKDILELNYKSKIEEMKKLFLNWSKRILTPVGKK